MNCPRCGSDTSVLDSRGTRENAIRRRRVCSEGHRFTTYETTVDPLSLIEQRRAALRAFRKRMTPEERKAFNKRSHLRRSARAEAKQTGESVNAIYQRWGVE